MKKTTMKCSILIAALVAAWSLALAAPVPTIQHAASPCVQVAKGKKPKAKEPKVKAAEASDTQVARGKKKHAPDVDATA